MVDHPSCSFGDGSTMADNILADSLPTIVTENFWPSDSGGGGGGKG